MINISDKTLCCGCGACADICPCAAIDMRADEQGFLFPFTDKEKCTDCGACNGICPIINAENKEEQKTPGAYACVNNNDETRLKSTSGGVFTALAENVIAEGGCVFGAAFDSDFNVRHICVESVEELRFLRGSKYVQSNTVGIYSAVRQKLGEGKSVLFSGTPCQIAALRGYLKKDSEKLLCVDIICHSVPSPLVWQKYKDELCRENGELSAVNFRSKKTGWINYSYCFEASFKNGGSVCVKPSESPYMKAFIRGLSVREACQACAFRSTKRTSDITLGDFWGIEKVYPQYAEDSGTSLVLVHTQKGENALKEAKDISLYETELLKSLTENPAAYKDRQKNPRREEYFEKLMSSGVTSNPALTEKRGIADKLLGKLKSLKKS